MEPDSPRRAGLAVFQAATLAALAAYVAHVAGVFGTSGTAFFENWLYNGLIVAAAGSWPVRAAVRSADRVAWLILGLGVLAWAAGEIHYTLVLADDPSPPYPSIGDAFFLAFYPASYVALLLLMPARGREFHASLWLDGVVGALAAAAVGAAIVFEPILQTSGGDAAAVATDLAYPLGDMVLLALVVGGFALAGWRPGRAWGFIGAGLALAAIGDAIFLYGSATGSYAEGTMIDALWPAATLLISFAAWQPARRSVATRLRGWRMLAIPTGFALAALALLVSDHYRPVNDVAIGAATATLFAVIVRMAMTFGENLRMVDRSMGEAMTDSLTGLGNRRKLMSDLAEELKAASLSSPRNLVIFDLDGFKRYNDTYGHPAGDALLARLGRGLQEAVKAWGSAYRLGGDEFCALIAPPAGQAEEVVARAAAALMEEGQGFEVKSSHGMALLPKEADEPAAALKVADQRLYAQKGTRQSAWASKQTRDVLLQMVHEREPELFEHVHDVAELAVAVGRRLGLEGHDLENLARAAELHDIGKMAIPDVMLSKPGPLDEVELGFMRQHTIVGARMLSAAPSLLPVAEIVRSSHERWDGAGYPDGLAGEEISIGSRIVAVCDAFHAMTEERPYQAAVDPDSALAELRRCAGSQFDPVVVETFVDVVNERRERPAAVHDSTSPGSANVRTLPGPTAAAEGDGDASSATGSRAAHSRLRQAAAGS